MKEKTIADTEVFARMAANKHGWVLNPDKGFYSSLIEGLTTNFNRYGYFMCPCRDSDGSREKDRDSICPCRWALSDVPEYGHCYCALYFSPEFAASGSTIVGIPDRRYLK